MIPVFNGERFLVEGLQSVFAQDYRPLEVIVVDDGSEDGTARLASQFPVRYIHQENGGPSSARNLGIAAAQGEYIAFADHDDLMMPGKLRLQAERLVAHPNVGLVLGHQKIVCEPGVELPSAFIAFTSPGRAESIPGTLPMVRKEVLALVGAFDPDLRIGEDTEWLSRALEKKVRMEVCSEAVTVYRFHGSNLSYGNPGSMALLLKILKSRVEDKRRSKSDGQPR